MKKVVCLFLALGTIAFGYQVSPKVPEALVVVDASVNNIPIAYDTTAGSQLYSNLGGRTAFDLCNETLVAVAVRVQGVSCASATGDNYQVPAGVCLSKENIAINKVLCLRSLGAAITTGSVSVSIN